jgi:filamentous hemagglutinin family protein
MIRHNPRPILGLKSRAVGGLAALLSSGATAAYALPSFNSIAGTNGTSPGAVYSTSGSTGTVDQTNSRVVIKWNSFNIDAGQSVTFNQPTKGSIAFNVVPAGQLTTINGSLSANGGIWLFSPAGILIGSGGSVSVGSFVASTGIFDTTAGSTQMNQALNTNSVQIAAQATPGQGYIELDAAVPGGGSMTGTPAATINADAGFVLLHSPTINQNGSVSATDAVVYNADEDVQPTFVPTNSTGPSGGVTLTSETSVSGKPSESHIAVGGSTSAGTWFEADAAEDVSLGSPGYAGVINLSGSVIATGMKNDTANPNDPGNGYSVILNGDDGGDTSGPAVTTIDASGGTVNASSGIYANAASISIGQWTNTGGAVTIDAAGPAGVLIDPPLVSTGSGLVSIVGPKVEIDSDVTAAGSVSILSYATTVGPNVTIQAGSTIAGSSLIAKSTGDIYIDPSSSLFVGPSLGSPTGTLALSAGATITPQDASFVDQVKLGTGGDLTVGVVDGTSVSLEAAPLGGVGGTLDVEGAVAATNSVFMSASQLTLGNSGSIGAGLSSGFTNSDEISTNSGSANVVLQNAAAPGAVPVAAGDIDLGAPVNVNTPNGDNFVISAYHAINVTGQITESGLGEVDLFTDQGGGNGNDYAFTDGGALSFTGAPDGGEALNIDNQSYTLIFNLSDLLNINASLNGEFYALAAPLNFASGNSATVFTAAPIASTIYAPFTSTFTGLGNTISNLIIQAAPPVGQTLGPYKKANGLFYNSNFATNGALGLFGFVGSGGVVRDVNLSNAQVSGGDGFSAGALVGYLDGTVMNASASGTVTVGGNSQATTGGANGDTTPAFVGGLVGASDGQIIDSQSSAIVSALGGGATAGGLVGMVVNSQDINGDAIANSGMITNSSASGSVTVTDGGPRAGGLVGWVDGYNGGFQIDITGSSATGTVTGADEARLGGFVGESDGAFISNSFATGAVSGGTGSNVGGFGGYVFGDTVTTSYATGAVSQTVAGTDNNVDIAGGFAGYLAHSSIAQSYSTGAVNTIGGPDAAAVTLAGGFAGEVDSNSSAGVDYSLSAVTSTTSANADLGGFAGLVQNSSSVDQVYATGLVSGLAGSTTAGLVAVLGTSNESAPVSSLTDSYWDTGTTGQSVGYHITTPIAMGGMATASADTGITGASVYSAATYANFDFFASNWVLIPGVTRPILRSEYSTTINNAHQLQLMELDPAATYTLANDIDATGTSAAAGMAGGLWNPTTGFSPIGGNGEAAFTGTFDGQGHTISGLTITFKTADPQTLFSSLTTDGVVGLFGFVGPGGVLENVNLANAKVSAGDGMIAGALVGASLGSVNNASSSGTVSVGDEINTGQGITADAGGLVGATAGLITNSYSSATVTGDDAFAGGLLGTGGDGAIIINSYATGDVSVTAYPMGGIDTPAAGGLVGEFSGSNGGAASAIAGGYASGAVGGGGGSNIGGFIGSLGDAMVTDAYATGAVTQAAGGANGSNSAAGGFVGSMEDGAQINNAYASGDVSSQAAATGQFTSAGGFAGQIEGDGTGVYDAYALGAVDIKGTGAGVNPAGGFAGAIDENGEADHVYATGLVSGPGAVGGLVGQVGSVNGGSSTGGSISYSYWDEGTTGQSVGAPVTGMGSQSNNTPIGGTTGLSPYDVATYANFDITSTTGANIASTTGSNWFIAEGATRPILESEYSTNITNAHQLQLIDLNLNGYYTLGADIDATNVDGASGLWNPATGFSPIGTADAAFGAAGGKLNGQGHTITNLTVIGIPTTGQTGSSGQKSDGAAGLFGFIGPSGMVQNIQLTNVNVSGGDGMEVGALAGDSAGQIINATSSGSVTVLDGDEVAGADARAGGLVGDLTGTVQNSSSSVTVKGGQASVGGLVGELEGGSIQNSFATGAVSVGTYSDESEIPVAGGLVGSTTIIYSYYTPSITGSYATGCVTAGGGSVAGGFVGASHGSITTSYSTGSVTQAASPDSEQNEAGGFAGEVSGGSVTQSFSTGDVKVTGSSTQAQVGGFVGELVNNGAITDAYATGDVTVSGSTSDYAGGFAGAILDGGGSITNVYATGQVTANGDVGGLVGYLDGSINDGYWNEGTAHPVTSAVGFTDTNGNPGYLLGVGGASGNDPFSQYTYQGFDFSLADYGQGGGVWTIPSAGEYPQLYGVSHVVTFTATALGATSLQNNAPIVYGNYPVYTVVATGLQGGDTYESAVQALQVQPIDPNLDGPPAVGYSGYYNVNLNDAYGLNDPYILSIGSNAAAASGPLVTYRTVFNDNNTNFDGTLTITPAQLTLVATSDTMQYNGQTEDTGQNSTPSSTGLVPGDYYAATQSYDDADAGSRTLTVDEGSAQIYDNNDGANYNVNYDETQVAGSITAEPIVITATTDDRPYDGDIDSSQTPTVSGQFYGDGDGIGCLSQAYVSKDVMGTDLSTLQVTGYTLNAEDSADYSITTQSTAGTITPLALTATLSGPIVKPYDGTTTATIGMANYSLSPVIGNDQVGLNDPASGTYDTQNVGIEKLVTVSGLQLTGNDAEDYSISPTVSANVGEIDKVDLTLSAVTDTKTYDGTTDSSGLPTEMGLAPSDTLGSLSQSFAVKDVIVGGFSTLVVNSGYTITESDGSSALGNYIISTTPAQGSIMPLALTASLTNIVDKPYDGTTAATLAPDNYSLSPVIGGDQVGLNDPASGTYDTQNVGMEKLVSVSGLKLTGNDAEDYSVSPTVSGDVGEIDKVDLTLSAVTDTKTYDGTTDSSGMPTELGLAPSDTLGSLSQSFAVKDVIVDGFSTLVVNPGYTITESDGSSALGNYIISTKTAQGTINAVDITLSAVPDSKVYDGNTDSSQTPTASKLFSTDSVDATQSFTSKDVVVDGSSTLVVNPGYVIDDGDGGADYNITAINPANGAITPLALTAGLTGTVQKVYDGDTTATLGSDNYSLPNVVEGDDVTLNDPTSGTYDNRNAGTGKTVSVTGLQLGGDEQEDYSLTSTTASGPVGIITQAPLTLTAVTETKTYDGTLIADATPTNSALIEGDSVSDVTEAFGSKNVMGVNGSTLSVNGYTIDDGNGGNNYKVTLITAPGTINAAPLTLAAAPDTKTYDGTTASSATPTESGLVTGDSISGLGEAYDSKDAGARTLSVDGYTIDDGNGGGNYIVTTTIAPGTIDQKALTASLVGSVSKQYDGNTDAALATDNYSLAGVVSGDQVSLNDPTSGTYDTPAAGTHKLVSVGGLVLSGGDAANYIVNGTAAAPIGAITAPAQPIVYVFPPVDLTQIDLNELVAAVNSVVNFTTTVVNVFPVGNVNNSSNFGDNTPITGSGNRDLWTGWDDSDNPCPPGSSPNCHTGNGGHP